MSFDQPDKEKEFKYFVNLCYNLILTKETLYKLKLVIYKAK